MEGQAAAELEELFAHSGWVRRLARSLVGEQHAADLVQETWVAALARTSHRAASETSRMAAYARRATERPAGDLSEVAEDTRPSPTQQTPAVAALQPAPGEKSGLEREPLSGAPLRRWTATVVRNLARRHWRGEGRRTTRERAVARAAARSDDASALEDLEVHQRLVEAVRALAEPYRTAIHLRYFQELPPRDIALRLDVPLRTVNTRLARALEMLRERLDRRHRGDRGAWMALFVPFAKQTNAALVGGWIVDAKLKLLIAVAAVAALGTWYVVDSRGTQAVGLAPAAAPIAQPELAQPASGAAPERVASPAGERRAESSSAPAPGAVAESEVAASVVRGIVVDLDDRPVAGLAVALRPDEATGEDLATTRTDAQGAFEMPAPANGHIATDDPRWTVVLQPVVRNGNDGAVLVVAPRQPLAGVVVDAQGLPVEGASVWIVANNLRAAIHRVLDTSREVRWKTSSDAQGRFELPDAPALPQEKFGARLRAERPGYKPAVPALPDSARDDLRLVLDASGAPARVNGSVVDRDGAPVEGAWVALGDASVKCDAHGEFEFDFSLPGLDGNLQTARTLRAVKAGFLPATLECAAESPDAPGAWPDPLVLRLAGEALTLAGRVVDADGKPVAGASIKTLDREPFGMMPIEVGGSSVYFRNDVEAVLAGQQFPMDLRTDADGGFSIKGLQDKRYRLRVVDGKTLIWIVTVPLAAGDLSVEIRLPGEPRRERVAGVVVSKSGTPVGGATVSLLRMYSAEGEPSELSSEATFSDAQGRFEFRDVARAADRLRATAPGGTATPDDSAVVLADDASAANLRVIVPLSCHVQVDLSGTDLKANMFGMLDQNGAQMTAVMSRGDLSMATYTFELHEGRSEALTVLDSASTLVLYQGETEVRRMPIRLEPGKLNVIRP